MEILTNQIIEKVNRFPTVRPIADKVIKLCSQPERSMPELLKVISSDPILTVQLLRIANAYYYNYPRMISSIDRAVIVLGFDLVKELTLIIALMSFFNETDKEYHFHQHKIWKHSTLTGVAMKVLGETYDSKNKDLLYIGGLLHDFGKLVLCHTLQGEYYLLLQKSIQEKKPLYIIEKKYLSFDHAEIGARLIQQWNLPMGIELMVCFHHKPFTYQEKDRNSLWIKLICLGNMLIHSLENTKNEEQISDKDKSFFAEHLSLSDKEIERIKSMIKKEIQAQKSLLELF
jgi:HD-like signal output (HDOD) protein